MSDQLLREWKPTKKQQDFISLPFDVFEALYGGAAGSGKSELIMLLPAIYRFVEKSRFKGLILRRTFPELESEIIGRSKDWYSHFGATYNESKRRWTFPSGAVMQFGHAEREDDVRKYDTAQYNYIGWDESTSFTQFQYEYLSFSRCRSSSSDLPAIVRSGTNPGNVGHAYFRDRFVAPYKTGGKLIVDNKTNPPLLRYFIQATVYDNEHLLNNNPRYVQQLQNLPEADKRAKLYGDWWTFEGQVFREWRISPLGNEPANACHVIAPFEIPLWWPKVIAIDWGFSAFCWIGWFAIAPNGRIYLYREWCKKQVKHEDWLAELINLTGDERESVDSIFICHSANQNRGEEATIKEKVHASVNNNGFSCTVNLGSRNRVQGKMNVHEYLRWENKVDIKKIINEPYSQERADKLLRLYGSRAFEQYIGLYTESLEQQEIPKLQIFNTCTHLIDTIPNCVYDEANVEDVKEFSGDDPYDGLRIGLDGIKDYLIRNAKKLAAMKEQYEAVAQLAKGDQTSFYRRMEIIDSRAKKSDSFRRRGYSRARRM